MAEPPRSLQSGTSDAPMCAQNSQVTLVLADDNREFASVCRLLLTPEFELIAAVHSGRHALDAIRQHDPDILILDISMPDMTGIEVIEALSRQPVRTRAVVLTMHQDPTIADRLLASGASGFVVKSRMARDLLPAIHAALAGEQFLSPLQP